MQATSASSCNCSSISAGEVSAHTADSISVTAPDEMLSNAAAGEQRPLYQVLEQQQAQVGGNLMGSDHTYVIPGGKAAPGKKCASDPAPLLPPQLY